MKGVIVQVGEPKSIVLFNNGKIGAVPTPAVCHVGMVIDVSYNVKKFIFPCIFIFIALAGILLQARFLCFSQIGYVQMSYGEEANKPVSLELSYNYFEHVISVQPLNTFSVAPIMDMHIKGKSVSDAYRIILKTLGNSEMLYAKNYITVRIAQDNLEKAKKIEQELAYLTDNVNVNFELYTLELYQKAKSNGARLPQKEQRMRHRGHHNGRRNYIK
ncbi:MAG: hypothetical protein Ta2F_03960 [Termitinemataceae bacterium]|nr:MAG: hypothetical protein Ta2F_03960 [Termitinemataceae bacterium]